MGRGIFATLGRLCALWWIEFVGYGQLLRINTENDVSTKVDRCRFPIQRARATSKTKITEVED
jgi:hypothetical protein